MSRHRQIRIARSSLASLQATLPLMPTVASAFTIVVYILWQNRFALLIGGGATLIVWLLLALLCLIMGSVSVQRANARTYGDFSKRLEQLKDTLAHIPADRAEEPQVQQAQAQLERIEKELSSEDSRWIRGDGYNTLWRALHTAEEELISAAIPDEGYVIQGGQVDESRLLDSKITAREKLLLKLRHALYALSPSTKLYFLGRFDPPDKDSPQSLPPEARGVLAEVRHEINDFNDTRYHALASTRNMYLDILPLVGLAVYLVLVIAIAARVGQSQIEAAAAFYVAGVVTGFLWVWYRQTKTERTVQDFGLATASLFRPLVISGVAAIIAVVAIPVMIPNANPSSDEANATATPAASLAEGMLGATPEFSPTAIAGEPTPSSDGGAIQMEPTPTPGTGEDESSCDSCDSDKSTDLKCVFSLQHNMLGLLFAFIFGASPEALLTMLKLQGQKYVDDLKSTEAGEGGTTT